MTQSPNNAGTRSSFTPGPLKKLFADRRDAQFWQTEGMRHSQLFWVRSMLTMEVEPPPFTSVPSGQKLPSGPDDARARQTAYGFLASVWCYPSPEMHANVHSPDFVSLVGEAWATLTGEAWGAEIGSCLQSESLTRLREEYTRLFYDSYLPFIPPYESVYYNERQVMGKRAAAVSEFYRRAGLAAEGEMPDHISHECEFAAALAQVEAELLEAGSLPEAAERREMQDEFLREHLLPWGVKFCADLACLARGDFYKATARLGTALFNAEWVRLGRKIL